QTCALPILVWQNQEYYLGTVVVASGYPAVPKQHIALPDLPQNVFYAGVVEENGQLYSVGGRIFTLIAHASSLKEAQKRVNEALEDLNLGGFYYRTRSEEHTSELQSRFDLVCRLLLEKKK